jgi:hypothetical protein
VGKVKVDDTDKTMSTNGEIGANGQNQVSINRPDLWTANVEYNFGNNLYGQRFTGTISADGGVTYSEKLNASGRPISYGGWFHTTYQFAGIGSDGTNKSLVETDASSMMFNSSASSTRSNAPYDIWVTYKK